MTSINVNVVPSNTNVDIQDANNINVGIAQGANVGVAITPTPTQNIQVTQGNNIELAVQTAPTQNVQITQNQGIQLSVVTTPVQKIQVNRGVAGPPGPNSIGGYPINVAGLNNFDALMFVSNEWTNIPQTEISDGGNF
jgi:hypothetical protein